MDEIKREISAMLDPEAHSDDSPSGSAGTVTENGRQTDAEGITDEYAHEEVSKSIREKIAEIVRETQEKALAAQVASPPPSRKSFETSGDDGDLFELWHQQDMRRRREEQERYLKHGDEIAFVPDVVYCENEQDALMNAKIAEMRRLNEIFYNGYMTNACAERSIERQGEFMADVTDDFNRKVFCGIPRPIYGVLSNPQLRTYFTWRTDARRGVYGEIDPPYVYLYCTELLNKIGVMSAADAFGRLIEVWEQCRGFADFLDKSMPRWLKDFYAYNNITEQYPDITRIDIIKRFEEGFSPQTIEIMSGNYSSKLDYLMENSEYDLSKSVFMSEQIKPVLDGALEAALTALDKYFSQRQISFSEMLCGRMKKDYSWTPFENVYVKMDRMEGFHEARTGLLERYCIKRGTPSLERYYHAPYKGFIGYVLKSVESVVRQRTGFRHRITANIKMALNDYANREKLCKALYSDDFEQIIPNAVNAWCDKHGIFPPKKKSDYDAADRYGEPSYDSPQSYGYTPEKRIEVNVDIGKLSEIRNESDELARKLIIEDDISEDSPDKALKAEEEIIAAAERAAQEDFAQSIAEVFAGMPFGWREFAQSLTASQFDFLEAASLGEAERFCHESELFPETVYEQINTAALDSIGDIIIENGAIIEDYAQDVSELLRRYYSKK